MTVSIPFAFGVGDQTLPSGKYIVLTATPERSIRVVSSDGKHSAVVNTLPNYAQAASENSRLVFHKYGPEYFLVESSVRTSSQACSYRCCPIQNNQYRSEAINAVQIEW